MYGCRASVGVVYVRFVVSCFLVVDREIIAFEPYRPFVGSIWRECENLDLFVSPNESFVACLLGYTYVSYKYFKGAKWEFNV